MALAGLKLIVPSSVTAAGTSSASISATGKVTFTNLSATGSSWVSVNGCFSSSYDNYLIVMTHVSNTEQAIFMRLRASGTDTTSNYNRQQLGTYSTTIYGQRSTSVGNFEIGTTSTTAATAHMWLYGPNLAQATAFRSLVLSDGSGGNPNWRDNACTQTDSTQFDGFTLTADPTDTDGKLCIYGFSQ